MKEELLEKYQSIISSGPLNGKIVLGFCYYVAGPVTLQNLVQQGALVIKLERKPFGDPSRYVFSQNIFNTLAHGQLSVSINPEDADDQALLKELFEISDVIVDNRSVRAKENDLLLNNFLGNDNKSSPVIYCSIDGYPDAKTNNMTGLDASAQACTGLAYTNCATPSNPLKVGVPVLDITTGLLAANYILANLAFLNSPSIKNNQVIQIAVSLAGTSVWLQSNQFLDAMSGNEYLRTGNQDRYAAPFSYYTAKDGLISIATVNEGQFQKFCTHVLENSDFHAAYPTIGKRIHNQDAFENGLNALLMNESTDYWLEKCKKHNIPAAPVLTVSQSLKQDFVKKLITSSDNGMPIVTHGATNSFFTNKKEFRAAPKLGQDNQTVRSTGILGLEMSHPVFENPSLKQDVEQVKELSGTFQAPL